VRNVYVAIAILFGIVFCTNLATHYLTLAINPGVYSRPVTPFSTDKDQQRVLANTLGGKRADYVAYASGWKYDGGNRHVKFIVPKGALVDTTHGMRWEGQHVRSNKFYIWWP